MMNGCVSMEYLMIGKPMNRLRGFSGASNHPIKIGCCPNRISDEFETTPCFNRVATGTNPNHLTASAVFDRIHYAISH